MKKTYNYNREEVPLEHLPEELRSHVTQAVRASRLPLGEDFFEKLDEAPTQQAKKEIINTHPYNNEHI